jgi:hypothetical protein
MKVRLAKRRSSKVSTRAVVYPCSVHGVRYTPGCSVQLLFTFKYRLSGVWQP